MQTLSVQLKTNEWVYVPMTLGWVPASGKCPGGDPSGLDASVLTVSNVKVSGVVVQGPTPTLC